MSVFAWVALLFAASPIEDSGVVRLDFDDRNDYRVGDVAFGRVIIENRGEDPIENVQTRFASLGSTAFYELWSYVYPYSFRFDYANSAPGKGKRDEQTMQPADRWIVDYPLLSLPEPKHFDHDFWEDILDGSCQFTVTLQGNLRRKISLEGTGELYLRRRPDPEMTFLRELFRESEFLRDEARENIDLHRPHPSDFGLRIVDEDLIKRLIAFEDQLSPGTLRDIVKLTRLMRVLYSSKDAQTRNATISELLQWLDTLPTIQREALAIMLDRYIRSGANCWFDPNVNPGYARLLRGVIQHMPESAYGSPTFREDHLRYLEDLKQ